MPKKKIDDINEAKRVLELEANSILKARERLDASFEKSIATILESVAKGGKVVVSGVGKSGKIAAKVAATFSSLSIPSVFLHANDGAHGDLGAVSGNDCVLLLSNSGNTDELMTLLPRLRALGTPILAIVGKMDSQLASRAHAAIDGSVDSEACTFNLAPTSSTAVAMALGDALAVVSSLHLDFKEERFAENHPGGPLGRRLSLLVSDLMHPADTVAWVGEDASVEEVVEGLTSKNLGAVFVRRSKIEKNLSGIITDGDLRRALRQKTKFFEKTAVDIMTRSPVTVNATEKAIRALELMENRKSQISVLPVVDASGNCAGLIRLHDIIGKV